MSFLFVKTRTDLWVLLLDVSTAPGTDSCLDAPPSYVMIDVVGAPMA